MGEKAGMVLSYDWQVKRQEDWRTGFLLLRSMKFDFLDKLSLLMRFNKAVETIRKGEYYISNVATH